MIKRLRTKANEAWLVFQVGATLLAFLEALNAAQAAREAKVQAALVVEVELDDEPTGEPDPESIDDEQETGQ